MGAIKWVRLNGMGVIKQDGSHPIWCQLAVQIYIYIGVALYAFLGKKKGIGTVSAVAHRSQATAMKKVFQAALSFLQSRPSIPNKPRGQVNLIAF